MFMRIVDDWFGRRPRHKLLTGAALALGMGVATAALSVSLDVGDRLARDSRTVGANLLVTPQADSLPLEIGGVDYRPVNAGAYLPEADLPKLKTIFWHNNIMGFAPVLEIPAKAIVSGRDDELGLSAKLSWPTIPLIGTWASHPIHLEDGTVFETGTERTNPWWQLMKGRWFTEGSQECVVGKNLARKAGTLLDGKLLQGLPIGDNLVISRGENEPPLFLKAVGIHDGSGPEDDAVLVPLAIAQQLARKPGQYRKLYVDALTKPADAFAKRDPKTFIPKEYNTWFCTPYISSIAFQIQQELPGTDVRVIRRVAEGEGVILTRVRMLLWLVTGAALLPAALAVRASSPASVIG